MTSPLDVIVARCREINIAHARARLTGVYLLISKGEIVYVGQSLDVETRIALHVVQSTQPTNSRHGETQPNRLCKEFDRAIWFPVPRSKLKLYEGALIRALNPKYCFAAHGDEGRDREILARLGLEPNDIATAAFKARRRACWPATEEKSRAMLEIWRRKRERKQREARAEKRRLARERREANQTVAIATGEAKAS